MPTPDLFKEKFLKSRFGNNNTTVKDIGKKLVQKRNDHLRNSKTAILHEEQNKAVADFMQKLRIHIDVVLRSEWDPKTPDKPETMYFGDSFMRLANVYDDKTFQNAMTSVATTVKQLLIANGLRSVEVEEDLYKFEKFELTWFDKLLGLKDHDEDEHRTPIGKIKVRGIVKSFMENADDNFEPREQEHAPTRTGLKGECCICLEKEKKLLSFTPCGHTACVKCSDEFLGKKCPTCRQDVFGAQGVFPN